MSLFYASGTGPMYGLLGTSLILCAGHASKEATLQSCLKEFFSQEEITWECPAEKQSKKKTRRESLAEAVSASPQSPATPKQGASNGFARRTVSFSGKQMENAVCLFCDKLIRLHGFSFRLSCRHASVQLSCVMHAFSVLGSH